MNNTVTTGVLSSNEVIPNNTLCEVTAIVITACGNSSVATMSKLSHNSCMYNALPENVAMKVHVLKMC